MKENSMPRMREVNLKRKKKSLRKSLKKRKKRIRKQFLEGIFIARSSFL